jgi:hypothetical protein
MTDSVSVVRSTTEASTGEASPAGEFRSFGRFNLLVLLADIKDQTICNYARECNRERDRDFEQILLRGTCEWCEGSQGRGGRTGAADQMSRHVR